MNNGRIEYTFLWFIENYSYCWHRNGEVLASPEFTAEGLENTVWILRLYPRGSINECKGYISLFLNRKNKIDDSPKDFPLKLELSFLANDGSSLCSDDSEYVFQKGKGYGQGNLANVYEVLVRREVDYLPQDTLSVRCKIWKGGGNTQQVIEIAARTRIGTAQISFFHVIENFSKLKPNEKQTIHFRSPSKKNYGLSSSLHFIEDSGEGKIRVQLTPSDTAKILAKCRLHLMGASGENFECGKEDNRLDAVRKDIQNLSLSLTRQEILNEKAKYLPEDKLLLSSECFFSTGVEYEKIEKIQYKKPFVSLEHITNIVQKEDIFDAAQKLSACSNVLDDLKSLYDNKVLTDVEVKTKTKSFPAHKLLLCVRSPVFKTMLTTDRKEKYSNSIQIEELDDDIVQQFMHFLYTDKIEDLHWESATKLYYCGDKYDIERLKIICSSFLLDNITTTSASELLVLADRHNDSDIKRFVEDFILKHEEEVFGSEEWLKLTENNSELVCKTMLLKYRRKL